MGVKMYITTNKYIFIINRSEGGIAALKYLANCIANVHILLNEFFFFMFCTLAYALIYDCC